MEPLLFSEKPMEFRVGQQVYPVRVSVGPIHIDGEEVWAMTDPEHREIVMSCVCPLADRMHVMRYEFRRLWKLYMPEPADPEADCKDAANFAAELEFQLEQQGGERTILSLKPSERGLIQSQPSPAMPLKSESSSRVDRRECPCTTIVMCGEFRTGMKVWDRGRRQWRVERHFICEGCGGVDVWWEGGDAEGSPNGQLLDYPEPRYLTGDAARQFLRHLIGRPAEAVA